jgi:hypothetical protein
MADEIYVNGILIGKQGSLTPNPVIHPAAEPAVFAIPPGTSTPGAATLVALRAWYVPGARLAGTPAALHFTIDSSRFVRLARRARHQRTIISLGPQLGANLIITCFGLALLLLWRGGGGRDILLCAALLLLYAPPLIFSDLQDAGVLHLPWVFYAIAFHIVQAAQMDCTLEFTWTILAIRNRFWMRLAQLALIVFNLGGAIAQLAEHPSLIVAWSFPATLVCLHLFNAISLGANLWALLIRRQNRLIAAALALIPIASTLPRLGIARSFNLGPFSIDGFEFAFLLSAVALFVMLGRRAWHAWHEGNQLRAEFDAARDIQERLVVAPPSIPGFRIATTYLPALQVGGDFFHVRPGESGGVLLVIGDVSGKGLRAAMAVSAIVGALRALPLQPPSQILAALNRGLAGNLGGGFVTCCAAHIDGRGCMTIANAGHIPPWRNGVEVNCGNNLPLGIAANLEFSGYETQLAPGDSLTFVSDGIVEAQNAERELFGFDRTAAISTRPAEEIARAAQAHGQEDDITVLTLTFAAQEIALA